MTGSPAEVGCPEAEAAVLGCVLHLPAGQARALVDRLEVEDFADPRHRGVLAAARALLQRGEPADPVTVLGELRRCGLEASFAADRSAGVFLVDLYAAAPAVASAGHYLRVVLEHGWRRRVLEAGVRLQQAAGQSAVEDLHQLVCDELGAILHVRQRYAPSLTVAS